MSAYPSAHNLGLPGIYLLDTTCVQVQVESINNRRIGHPFVDALYCAHMAGAGFVLSPTSLWNLVHDGIALYFQTRPSQYGRAGFEQMNQRMRHASRSGDGRIHVTLDAQVDGNQDCSALPILCQGNLVCWGEMQKQMKNIKAHLINNEPVFGSDGEKVGQDEKLALHFGTHFRADGYIGNSDSRDKTFTHRFACNIISPRTAAQAPSVTGVLDDASLAAGKGISAYYLTGTHEDWCALMNQLLLKSGFRPLYAWLSRCPSACRRKIP